MSMMWGRLWPVPSSMFCAPLGTPVCSWRAAIPRVWFGGKVHWQCVAGPLTALIANLFEVGYVPSFPELWSDASGLSFQVHDTASQSGWLSKLAGHLQLRLCEHASEHHLGRGMEQGVCWSLTRALHARFSAAESAVQSGALECIITGACWFPARRAAVFASADDRCPRCLAP